MKEHVMPTSPESPQLGSDVNMTCQEGGHQSRSTTAGTSAIVYQDEYIPSSALRERDFEILKISSDCTENP